MPDRQPIGNVRFGSLADLPGNISLMSALGRKADVRVPDFKGKISTSWIAIAKVRFSQ